MSCRAPMAGCRQRRAPGSVPGGRPRGAGPWVAARRVISGLLPVHPLRAWEPSGPPAPKGGLSRRSGRPRGGLPAQRPARCAAAVPRAPTAPRQPGPRLSQRRGPGTRVAGRPGSACARFRALRAGRGLAPCLLGRTPRRVPDAYEAARFNQRTRSARLCGRLTEGCWIARRDARRTHPGFRALCLAATGICWV